MQVQNSEQHFRIQGSHFWMDFSSSFEGIELLDYFSIVFESLYIRCLILVISRQRWLRPDYNVVLMMASSDNPISILLSAKCRNGARRWKQHRLSEKRLKDLFAMLDMEKHLFLRRLVACLYFGSKVNII